MTIHAATITASDFAQVGTLPAFGASPTSTDGKMSPILATVVLSVAGGMLQAISTDRYVVGRITATEYSDELDSLPAVAIPSKAIMAVAKASKGSDVTVQHDDETRVLTFTWAGGTYVDAAQIGNIPPVGRLFTERVEIVGMPILKPGNLAKLDKVKPTEKHLDVLWEFARNAPARSTDRTERSPIWAQHIGSKRLTWDVLIQPNLRKG